MIVLRNNIAKSSFLTIPFARSSYTTSLFSQAQALFAKPPSPEAVKIISFPSPPQAWFMLCGRPVSGLDEHHLFFSYPLLAFIQRAAYLCTGWALSGPSVEDSLSLPLTFSFLGPVCSVLNFF